MVSKRAEDIPLSGASVDPPCCWSHNYMYASSCFLPTTLLCDSFRKKDGLVSSCCVSTTNDDPTHSGRSQRIWALMMRRNKTWHVLQPEKWILVVTTVGVRVGELVWLYPEVVLACFGLWTPRPRPRPPFLYPTWLVSSVHGMACWWPQSVACPSVPLLLCSLAHGFLAYDRSMAKTCCRIEAASHFVVVPILLLFLGLMFGSCQ